MEFKRKSEWGLALVTICGFAAMAFTDTPALAQSPSGAEQPRSNTELPPVTVDAPRQQRGRVAPVRST
ncbi:hypothetical protein, partial [Bradyrhizobium sp. Leo121]|uniref:hypothetical protein n=1 Tax=Bradyrhizobium sp. Leo121 TaxID=1571195 RepID=UPI001028F373